MKNVAKKLVLTVIILTFISNLTAAVDWDITEGLETIITGDDYGNIAVYNDAELTVTGGHASHISSYDSSIVNIQDYLSAGLSIDLNGQSTINVYGGFINGIGIGSATSATLNLYGGNIDYIGYPETDTFTINIYGYDFNYSGGFLTGKWLDGTDFSILVRNSVYPNDNINLIPEPTTLAILGLGFLCFRTNRKRR